MAVGFLGAFTTFSTFSMEAVLLHQKGESLAAILYVTLSVGLSLAAFVAAMALVRSLAS